MLAVASIIAIVRATTARPLPQAPQADEAVRRRAFIDMAAGEPSWREHAADEFPADAWSQDDAFHNDEYSAARRWAGEHEVRVGDVLSAIDEGMRANWPRPWGVWMKPTVPPCRPRPIH